MLTQNEIEKIVGTGDNVMLLGEIPFDQASDADRNRCAPGPACFGPGKRGVTRETGQAAMQVAHRTQTSGRIGRGIGFSSAFVMMRAPSARPENQ